MEITEIPVEGYERVVRAKDPASGLHALISVHDTTLGPALGGMRMWPYASEEDALTDVLRLSKGMTYKSAVAQTGLGGGKSVIIGNPKQIKSEALFLAMGRFVESLGGKYITAEDVNIGIPDLEICRRATSHVTGLSREDGGSGNPSPYTAYGVFLGVRAACGWRFGSDDLEGRTIAVQGVGAVGGALVERLVNAGAKVTIADIHEEKVEAMVEKLGVTACSLDEIVGVECDVFAPCALGAVIRDESVDKLRCQIIAGAANNILHEGSHGSELAKRGVLYAPDYVINAGGIINVSVEFREGGYDQDAALQKIERIPQALKEVWTLSEQDGVSPNVAADRLAEQILDEARRANA